MEMEGALVPLHEVLVTAHVHPQTARGEVGLAFPSYASVPNALGHAGGVGGGGPPVWSKSASGPIQPAGTGSMQVEPVGHVAESTKTTSDTEWASLASPASLASTLESSPLVASAPPSAALASTASPVSSPVAPSAVSGHVAFSVQSPFGLQAAPDRSKSVPPSAAR
jgi:hypothetical protein